MRMKTWFGSVSLALAVAGSAMAADDKIPVGHLTDYSGPT